MTIAKHYLDDILISFQNLKSLADRAIAQVDDVLFFEALNAQGNSIAVIVKHMLGNMRSRWTDFLTTDGEKPDRRRDTEFVIDADQTRAALLDQWDAAWQLLFNTIRSLQPDDLERTVYIRLEPHSVIQAIHRQMTHYGYHVGQIVLLAQHHTGDQWETLSIPRGESEAFFNKMRQRFEEP